MRTMPPRGTTSRCRAEALQGEDGIIALRDVVKSEAQVAMFQELRRVQMFPSCLLGAVQEQDQDVRMMFRDLGMQESRQSFSGHVLKYSLSAGLSVAMRCTAG